MASVQEETNKNMLAVKGEFDNCQQNMKNMKSTLDKTKISLAEKEEKLAAIQSKLQLLEKSNSEAEANFKKASLKIDQLTKTNQELKDNTILLEKRVAVSQEKLK